MRRRHKSVDGLSAVEPRLNLGLKVQPMPFAWIGQGAQVLSREGVDIDDLLCSYGIGSTHEGLTPNVVISGDQMVLMCLLIIRAASDESHGVCRAPLKMGTASLAVRAMLSAPRLETAINTISRFYDLGGSGIQVSLQETFDEAILKVGIDDPRQAESLIVEEIYASAIHMWLSYFLGRRLKLKAFVSPYAHPGLGGVHPYLRCPVRSGSTTAIVFDRSLLANEGAHRRDEHPLEAAVLSWSADFVHETTTFNLPIGGTALSNAVFARLLEGDASAPEIGGDLGLSVSVLRKRLAADGTSFRGLRKRALIQRLAPVLGEGQDAETAAFTLGYSDGRSLRRAIKAATGATLTDLRATTAAYPIRPGDALTHIKNLSKGMEV